MVVLGITATGIVPSASRADNTDLMAITPPSGGYRSDQYAAPIFPTRALTFTIAYDSTYYEGDSIQCQLQTAIIPSGSGVPRITSTPWGPCGPVAPGPCPKTVCYSYTPPVTQDAEFTVSTRLVDVNGDSEGGAGEASFDFSLDTTPPQTKLRLSYLGGQSPSGDGRHASFTFTTDDDNADFQCSLTRRPTASGPWKRCRADVPIPFRIPLTTRLLHFAVRAVDPFGRPDPTPATDTFSSIPCRATVLRRARTLAALARTGMRVRITCVTPSAWHFMIVPISPLARRLEIDELGGYNGLFRRAGRSRTITVKGFPLRDFPPQFATRPLRVAYVTDPTTEDYADFGAPQRLTGRLAAS